MGRKRKQRRQPHGSAWLWKQTGCWYYTQPGTKKRIPLLDDHVQRIRGKENRVAAQLALAREKTSEAGEGEEIPDSRKWLVARVCSEYL